MLGFIRFMAGFRGGGLQHRGFEKQVDLGILEMCLFGGLRTRRVEHPAEA